MERYESAHDMVWYGLRSSDFHASVLEGPRTDNGQYGPGLWRHLVCG